MSARKGTTRHLEYLTALCMPSLFLFHDSSLHFGSPFVVSLAGRSLTYVYLADVSNVTGHSGCPVDNSRYCASNRHHNPNHASIFDWLVAHDPSDNNDDAGLAVAHNAGADCTGFIDDEVVGKVDETCKQAALQDVVSRRSRPSRCAHHSQ